MRDPIPVYVHLRRAKDVIDRDFAKPLDVPAIAREAHASRAHFVRSFKKAFGETPHQCLLRRASSARRTSCGARRFLFVGGPAVKASGALGVRAMARSGGGRPLVALTFSTTELAGQAALVQRVCEAIEDQRTE